MAKKFILAVIAIFILFSVLDYIMHGIILCQSYEATPTLWRPTAEMKMGLCQFVVLVGTIIFVWIYAGFFAKRGVGTGIKYGLLYGIAAGLGMGFGSYAAMPIPYNVALTWFIGTVIKLVLAGLVLGAIIRE